MSTLHTTHIAKHFRGVFTGGNWSCSNLKEQLTDVTWQEATTQVYGLNTIATLTYHIGYYVEAVLRVLQGGPLEAKDAYSFSHPPIHSEQNWQSLINTTLTNVDAIANLIEALPEDQLWETFYDPKYGNYYRNLNGIIEHSHYHLGQIAVVKKVLRGTR